MGKALVGVSGLVFALSLQPAASKSATHVPASDVRATLARVPPGTVSDQQIRVVDAGQYNVGVGVLHRPQGAVQNAIEHDKVTEVYYVLEGAGTLVTGGRLVNGKPLAPESPIVKELTGPSSTGTAVEAGERRRIAAGDVVVIPAGVPHWLGDVEGTIRYLVVRVDPERVLALR
jgi:mannose-6-phosphate isomerase-like protein (cupin superfamily)